MRQKGDAVFSFVVSGGIRDPFFSLGPTLSEPVLIGSLVLGLKLLGQVLIAVG
jgi:hypothetical protein